MRQRIDEITFVCIDCESTGLDPKSDHVIEVAVVQFTLSEIIRSYETLVDPQSPIPEDSMAIHHISQEMVTGKPTIGHVLPSVLEVIGPHPIVGHGVGFDIELLASSADRAGIPHKLRQHHSIDTLRLARHYGESPKNSLQHLCLHFNVKSDGAHRAMNDVLVNIDIFKHLVRKYNTLQQVDDVLAKPIKMRTMPLGKHKGRQIKDIPIDYLRWAAKLDFDRDLLFSIRSEIKRRSEGNNFDQQANPFANL